MWFLSMGRNRDRWSPRSACDGCWARWNAVRDPMASSCVMVTPRRRSGCPAFREGRREHRGELADAAIPPSDRLAGPCGRGERVGVFGADPAVGTDVDDHAGAVCQPGEEVRGVPHGLTVGRPGQPERLGGEGHRRGVGVEQHGVVALQPRLVADVFAGHHSPGKFHCPRYDGNMRTGGIRSNASCPPPTTAATVVAAAHMATTARSRQRDGANFNLTGPASNHRDDTPDASGQAVLPHMERERTRTTTPRPVPQQQANLGLRFT
jgi:hypothetical protein